MTEPEKKHSLNPLEGLNLTPDRLVNFARKWIKKLLPEPEKPEPSPPPLPRKFSYTLLFLKGLPWFCLGVFILTLFDIDLKHQIPADYFWRADKFLSFDGLLRMLSVTALVGFGTNWLAIKMLFYPRKKRPLLGQGLIPSRKNRIVMRLGESISKEIINAELILKQIRKSGLVEKHRKKLANSMKDVFRHPEFREDLVELGKHYVDGFLRSQVVQKYLKELIKGIDFESMEGLEGGLLRMYRFFKGNQDLTETLHEAIERITFRVEDYEEQLNEYLHKIPHTLEERGGEVEQHVLNGIVLLIEQVNVKKVIMDNLQGFDEIRLENLLLRTTSDQLQYIQYLGCLLGLIGGLFIWQPLESTFVIGSIVGTVYGLDVWLLRRRNQKKELEKKLKKKKDGPSDKNDGSSNSKPVQEPVSAGSESV